MAETCMCEWRQNWDEFGRSIPIQTIAPACPYHGEGSTREVHLWRSNPTGTVYRHPGGYGAGRVLGTPVVDDRRRAKHLTDAECAAMYWASHGVDTMGEGDKHWSRLSRRLTLHRFATNDQAV